MPGKVITFLRGHALNAAHEVSAVDSSKPAPAAATHARAARRPSSTPTISFFSSSSSPSASLSASPHASSEQLPLMAHDHNPSKRLSIPGLGTFHAPRSPKTSAKNTASRGRVQLDVVMESPPIVFYGPSTTSTGALLSGQIKVTVLEESVDVEQFKMSLAIDWTRKKPYHQHCDLCARGTDTLTSWTFLPGPTTLRRGAHTYPFSYLLAGDKPESTTGPLGSIEYALKATMACKPRDVAKPEPAVTLRKVLPVHRAILPAEQPRRSIRIFPPTNLTAHVELPSVIYPVGEQKASMRVDGIVIKQHADGHSHTIWRMKRLSWRLEETHKVRSPACPKHAAKAAPDAPKELIHVDTRTIGSDEMRAGWKSTYAGADGCIELEFAFAPRLDAKATCNTVRPGMEVSHSLVVEMVVSEEFVSSTKPNHGAPTGAARVLRMHFNLNMTNRAGMGISWDEEAPPMYEDVPASPPAYATAEIYDGPVSDDGIEDLAI